MDETAGCLDLNRLTAVGENKAREIDYVLRHCAVH